MVLNLEEREVLNGSARDVVFKSFKCTSVQVVRLAVQVHSRVVHMNV